MVETTKKIVATTRKIKALITDIRTSIDKNNQLFWVIRVATDRQTSRSYLSFSQDYNLSPRANSLLTNYQAKLVSQTVSLTIKKRGEKEKVIDIELEKNGS